MTHAGKDESSWRAGVIVKSAERNCAKEITSNQTSVFL
jgi:hypothetical protein